MKTSRRRFLETATAATALLTLNALPRSVRGAGDGTGKVKIGIVGSGRVGGTLGSVWVQAGHEVMFSSLHIEHDRELAASLGTNAHAGTPPEAATFGEVVMVSVPYHALPDVRDTVGELLKGKVVIDTCNPFVGRDGEIAQWAREKGAGLASKELLPGARIVRAFNAIGYARMGQAHEEPGRVGMPIASDDAEAVEVAAPLIRDIGYEPVLVGGLEMGKYLMPGTPLAGEHTPEGIREIVATLEKASRSAVEVRYGGQPHPDAIAASRKSRPLRRMASPFPAHGAHAAGPRSVSRRKHQKNHQVAAVQRPPQTFCSLQPEVYAVVLNR